MENDNKDWSVNHKSLWVIIGASNHSRGERQKDDFYATEPSAIDRLVAKYDIPHRVWEPACGSGCLSKRLEELGHEVISSDLVDRGYGETGINFFEVLKAPFDDNGGGYAILTNPPYKYVTEFVLHALELAPTVLMFCKTTLLESEGRYEKIFKKNPPKYMFQFVKRVMCAKNGDFDSYTSSAVAYAWFVWERGFKGKTTIDWI